MSEAKVPAPPADWYRPLAAHLKQAYLRYSFTQNTKQEVDFLYDVLAMQPGQRVLDVGCGPGRHAIGLAERGLEVVGIDLSADFIAVARQRAAEVEGARVAFFEMDALQMPFADEFDAVISICEGAFSLGLDDLAILKAMAAAAKPGKRLAVAGVNLLYVLTHMRDSGEFDPASMLFKETVEVIGADGRKESFDMWNSCYTPREMEWIANGAGLDPLAVYGIEPGAYRQQAASQDHPELLLLADKPSVANL